MPRSEAPRDDDVRASGAADAHGVREQRTCVFVHQGDNETQPAADRGAIKLTEACLAHVDIGDFRGNPRGPLGARTATLHRDGTRKLRENWACSDN